MTQKRPQHIVTVNQRDTGKTSFSGHIIRNTAQTNRRAFLSPVRISTYRGISRSPDLCSTLAAPSRRVSRPSGLMRLAHNYSDGIVPDLHRVPFQSIAELIPTATTAEILTFLQNNIFFEICPYFLPIHHIPIHYIR